jgi:hypothetical protein
MSDLDFDDVREISMAETKHDPMHETQTIIAIDPGANGGIAVYDSTSGYAAFAMPESDREKFDLLSRYDITVVYMEQVGGYVGKAQPGSAMFNFGKNYGTLIGILTALQIPLCLITPQKWQSFLGLGTKSGMTDAEWKRKLKHKAERLYPDLKPTLKTADSLLILKYAQHHTLLPF